MESGVCQTFFSDSLLWHVQSVGKSLHPILLFLSSTLLTRLLQGFSVTKTMRLWLRQTRCRQDLLGAQGTLATKIVNYRRRCRSLSLVKFLLWCGITHPQRNSPKPCMPIKPVVLQRIRICHSDIAVAVLLRFYWCNKSCEECRPWRPIIASVICTRHRVSWCI